MRYLIDREYRPTVPKRKPPISPGYATELRRELSAWNQRWAVDQALLHEVTGGGIPAVLYREDGEGRHGNFLDASYRAICAQPAWKRRFEKVHTSAKRRLLSHDPDRSELDSSNSSDALLMNIFCHPETLRSIAVCRLLNIPPGTDASFGYKPRIALRTKRFDSGEIDLKLDDLLIEAKLTEYDFQQAPRRLLERYARFAAVFDGEDPDLSGETVHSYQLLRGVLAADEVPEWRYCILCDGRRPDLIMRWHNVMRLVQPYPLRCRLQLLTWQELAVVLPVELQAFLSAKYGIVCKAWNHG